MLLFFGCFLRNQTEIDRELQEKQTDKGIKCLWVHYVRTTGRWCDVIT